MTRDDVEIYAEQFFSGDINAEVQPKTDENGNYWCDVFDCWQCRRSFWLEDMAESPIHLDNLCWECFVDHCILAVNHQRGNPQKHNGSTIDSLSKPELVRTLTLCMATGIINLEAYAADAKQHQYNYYPTTHPDMKG